MAYTVTLECRSSKAVDCPCGTVHPCGRTDVIRGFSAAETCRAATHGRCLGCGGDVAVSREWERFGVRKVA